MLKSSSGFDSNLCEHCHSHPKWNDRGRQGLYCSKRCSVAAATRQSMCEICHVKPKFQERGKLHPYCGRACASKRPAECQVRGCSKAPKESGFCSETHARDAVRRREVVGCKQCRILPASNAAQLCVTCTVQRDDLTYLEEAPPKGDLFKAIKGYIDQDAKSSTLIKVEKILEVHPTKSAKAAFESARQRLTNNGPVQTLSGFFADLAICNIGSPSLDLCINKTCGICSVLKSSFKVFAFGATFQDGPSGEGIYIARTAALADPAATSSTSTPYRVLVCCEVLSGTEQTLMGFGRSKPTISETDGMWFFKDAGLCMPRYVVLYTKR